MLRFRTNRRNYPPPTIHTMPTPHGEWEKWKAKAALRTTDGCEVGLSGDVCSHGHPTFFLRYFLDLGT